MTAHHYAGTLHSTDPGLRLAIGLPGSGKTYGTRAQVYDALRRCPVTVCVIDPTAEWAAVPRDLVPVTAGAYDLETVARHARNGARLILLRTPSVTDDDDDDDDDDDEPAKLLNDACRWARRHAARRKPSVTDELCALAAIVAPEAHRAAPLRAKLRRHVATVATAWRHERVALWMDTQRLALMSPTLRDLARETRFYSAGGKTDLATLAEIDTELPEAVRECARRFVRGEPGWHVRVSTVAIPPFTPTRQVL